MNTFDRIDIHASAIYKRLGDLLDKEDNLTFGQQMEIQECMSLAKDIRSDVGKKIKAGNTVTTTGTG